MNPALGLIGLARRGGLISMGEEPTGTACRMMRAAAVFCASDAAENSLRRARSFAELGGVPFLMLRATKEELGNACGRSSLAMFALLDAGMALSVAERLGDDPAAIALLSEAAAAEKALRRAKGRKKK